MEEYYEEGNFFYSRSLKADGNLVRPRSPVSSRSSGVIEASFPPPSVESHASLTEHLSAQLSSFRKPLEGRF